MKSKLKKSTFGTSYVPSVQKEALRIGNEVFTRGDLVRILDSASFRAARQVTKVLDSLGITNARQLSGKPVHHLIDGKHGLGLEAGWIMMNYLDAHGLDPERWVGGDQHDLVTLSTIARRGRKPQPVSKRQPSKSRAKTNVEAGGLTDGKVDVA